METKRCCLIIIIGLIPFIGISQTYDEKLQSLYEHTVPTLACSELSQMMESGKQILLLDTRTPEEYKVSHLPGAVLVDYDHFDSNKFVGLDKKTEVVVYCTVGYRSERIGEKLQKLGFTDVRNLYGGIFQWANEGGVLVNQKNISTDSVHTYSKKWAVWLTRGVKVN